MQLQEEKKLSVTQQMPLAQHHLQSSITNNTSDKHKKYLCATKTLFNERHSNRTQDFKHKMQMKCTKLSKYIWSLKNQGIIPIVKWRIVEKVSSKISPNYCKLCFVGKMFYH